MERCNESMKIVRYQSHYNTLLQSTNQFPEFGTEQKVKSIKLYNKSSTWACRSRRPRGKISNLSLTF